MIHKLNQTVPLDFWFELPTEKMFDFLVKGLRPKMDALVKAGELEYWFFRRLEYKTERPPQIGIFWVPAKQGLQLERELEVLSRSHGGRPTEIDPHEHWTDRAQYEERAGYGEGPDLHRRYRALDAQIILDMMEQHGSVVVDGHVDVMAMASSVYIAREMGIKPHEVFVWYKDWAGSFCMWQPSPDQFTAQTQAAANKLLETGGEDFVRQIRGYSQGDFGELAPLLKRYDEDLAWMRQVYWGGGVKFLDVKKRPPEFIIFHSYVHDHFARMGYNIIRETILTWTVSFACNNRLFGWVDKKA